MAKKAQQPVAQLTLADFVVDQSGSPLTLVEYLAATGTGKEKLDLIDAVCKTSRDPEELFDKVNGKIGTGTMQKIDQWMEMKPSPKGGAVKAEKPASVVETPVDNSDEPSSDPPAAPASEVDSI